MVFTDGTATEQTDQNAEQTQVEASPQESYLKKLVEAKGENWGDPEVLAKGKLEADGYIKNLEEQLTQMREDLKKQDYKDQVIEHLQTQAAGTTDAKPEGPNNNNGSADDQNTTASMSEEDLKSLVEKTLTQREKDSLVSQNLSFVEQELEKAFGTEAVDVVKKKAAELGMSMDRLKDIAAESPNAFLTLVGEKPKNAFNPMVQGSVRTEGVNMQTTADRNWAYYQNLRRTDSHTYYTPKVQQQLMEDKMRLGESFGN